MVVISFRLPFTLRVCLVLGLCSLAYLLVVDDSPRPSGVLSDARALHSAANKHRRRRHASSLPPSRTTNRTNAGTLLHQRHRHDAADMAAATRALYSIWLEPPTGSPTAVKSAAFIKSQAASMPGPPPVFEPHVTLVGGFEGTEEEVRNKTLGLAADLGAESGPLFWVGRHSRLSFHRASWRLLTTRVETRSL